MRVVIVRLRAVVVRWTGGQASVCNATALCIRPGVLLWQSQHRSAGQYGKHHRVMHDVTLVEEVRALRNRSGNFSRFMRTSSSYYGQPVSAAILDVPGPSSQFSLSCCLRSHHCVQDRCLKRRRWSEIAFRIHFGPRQSRPAC